MRKFTVQEVLQYLELPSIQIRSEKELEQFKVFAKQRRRELAKKYHPDKDPKNLDRMQTINAIVDFIQLLKYRPIRPQPVMKTYYSVTIQYSSSSTTGTASNDGTFTTYY